MQFSGKNAVKRKSVYLLAVALLLLGYLIAGYLLIRWNSWVSVFGLFWLGRIAPVKRFLRTIPWTVALLSAVLMLWGVWLGIQDTRTDFVRATNWITRLEPPTTGANGPQQVLDYEVTVENSGSRKVRVTRVVPKFLQAANGRVMDGEQGLTVNDVLPAHAKLTLRGSVTLQSGEGTLSNPQAIPIDSFQVKFQPQHFGLIFG